MKCNVEETSKATKKLQMTTDTLCASYRCDWNDDVHASYLPYVSMCKETVASILATVSKCNSLCNSLNAMNIEGCISQAESIVAEEAGLMV